MEWRQAPRTNIHWIRVLVGCLVAVVSPSLRLSRCNHDVEAAFLVQIVHHTGQQGSNDRQRHLLRTSLDPKSVIVAKALVVQTTTGSYYDDVDPMRLPSTIMTTGSSATGQGSHTSKQVNKKRNKNPNHDLVKQLFQRAKDLERKGQWRKAMSLFQDVLALDPTDAHTYLAVARLEAKRSTFTDHHQTTSIAISEPSTTTGPITAAAIAFQNGTVACPNNVHLWQAWAVYEESVGHFATARNLFESALVLDPFNPYVCHAYGRMEYLKFNNSQRAQALWERALAKSPTAALVCSLGELLLAQGGESQVKNTRELYQKHVSRVATNRERTEIYLAQAWLEERHCGDFEAAASLIEQSLAASPSSSVAQIARARLEGRRPELLSQIQHRTSRSGNNVKELPHNNSHSYPRNISTEEGSWPRNGRVTKHPAALQDPLAKRLASTIQTIEMMSVFQSHGGSASIHQKPKDGRIYNAWSKIHVKNRKFNDARRILRQGLKQYPNDHSLLQAAGKIEERLGNITGARNLYSESLRIQPSAPALVAYALLELKLQTREQQRKSAHEGSVIGKRFVRHSSKELQRVFALLEESLLLNSRHGPAYNAYARAVWTHTGDEAHCRAIYERGICARCSDVASIYHGYAQLELSLGNVDQARKLLLQGQQEVRRQDLGKDSPHRERAVFLTHTLGTLEMNRNDPCSALEIFLDGIRLYGNSSRLLLGAALCEVKLGNEDKARILFEQSVLNDQKHAQAWQAWGVMEMRAGNVKTAKSLFECGIKHAPRHGALWQAFATMQSRLGDVEMARELFETGIKNAPRHIPLYQSWAFTELREGNFTAAKSLIAKALTQDKRNGAGWLIAAEIEERIENPGLASLLLRRGIECAPTKPDLYRALGDALVRKGKINEAREVLELGIRVDPRHAPLYHSLAELEARVFNVDGLSKLHKRATSIFSSNVLEPPASSSEAWGARIRANRSRALPKGVLALAQRIVEDDTSSVDLFSQAASDDESSFFLEQSSLLEDGFLKPLALEDSIVEA